MQTSSLKRHFLADLLYSHTVALSVIRISIPNVYSVQWIALVICWVSKILKTVYSGASFAALCKEGKESTLLSKSTSRSSVSFSKRSTSNYKKLHQTASVTHIQTEWLHYDNTMNRIFVDLHISSQWWHQTHCQLSVQCGKMESIKDSSYIIILADESTALESLASVALANTGEHDPSESFCQVSTFTIIIF